MAISRENNTKAITTAFILVLCGTVFSIIWPQHTTKGSWRTRCNYKRINYRNSNQIEQIEKVESSK